jgi:SAM-dependent methyltransferase
MSLVDSRPEVLLDLIEQRYAQTKFYESGYNYRGEKSEVYMFGGTSLTFIVEQMIEKNGSCRMFDIGCGRAFHDFTLAQKFGRFFSCVGLTANSPQNEGLGSKGSVEIIKDNGDYLDRIMDKAGEFDLVLSRFGLCWFSDPIGAVETIVNKSRTDTRIEIQPLLLLGSDSKTKELTKIAFGLNSFCELSISAIAQDIDVSGINKIVYDPENISRASARANIPLPENSIYSYA